MRNLDWYMDEAKARNGFRSDRQLAAALGKEFSMASQWRTKRAWPGDEVMVQLAILAGVEPIEALVELNTWRADGTAKALYQSLARKLGSAAAIACFSLALGSQAWAMGGGSQTVSANLPPSLGIAAYLAHKIIHYATYGWRRTLGLTMAKAFARLGFALMRWSHGG